PAERRGAVMSMFYLLAYGALITPTLLVGIGATVWADTTVFSVFSVLTALLCFSAVVVERVLERRRRHAEAVPAPRTDVREASTVD
ncbi:MFS transporter, partial [Streptomyces sp. SID5926]|nr:MFS transporter [Streptomyces sp. SID5926]